MNRVILLVGPMGAGKTTFCREHFPEATRISQDDQGKDGHMKAYEDALRHSLGPRNDIIIDRTNFKRDQRKKFIDMAREYGYETHIIVMNHPYPLCYSRIQRRTEHPTLAAGNPKVKEALCMYYNQYQYVTQDEADFVKNVSPDGYDPYMQDLTHRYEAGRRFIVIGDVHGCYDELMELLDKVKWSPANDIIVFTGDLIDRGPKINEVLQFAMSSSNIYSIMSNHENKLFRHMIGNKVNLKSLERTLEQCDEETLNRFYLDMAKMPLIMKFDKYHVLHAGINPRYPIERQTKEFLMYARKFNPATGSFQDESMPYWYAYPIQQDIKILFGHEVHPNVAVVSDYACALDAGCGFGEKLRCIVIEKGKDPEIVEVESAQPKRTQKQMKESTGEITQEENPMQEYEALVAKGFLGKAVKGDLVLYNYTDKCTYEKAWNKYTLEARGLILNSKTGEVVARPFSKFFNVGETESTQIYNLPKEEYEVFDKLDGSFGTMYPYDGRLCIATRGSFESVQAKVATAILQEKYEQKIVEHVHPYLTLLFEIVYPENRMNMGARLVVDYGATRDIFLLGAIDRMTGIELDREEVFKISQKIGCPIAMKYYHTIEQMIELQKTLPAEKEGFVVRFASGFRVKIKGNEYMKMSKLLNSITPLNMWELMSEDDQLEVPSAYLMTIPEEYRDEALEMIYQLKSKAKDIRAEIELDVEKVSVECGGLDNPKTIGMWIQKNSGQLKHSRVIFPYVKGVQSFLNKYVKRSIRPTNNIL